MSSFSATDSDPPKRIRTVHFQGSPYLRTKGRFLSDGIMSLVFNQLSADLLAHFIQYRLIVFNASIRIIITYSPFLALKKLLS